LSPGVAPGSGISWKGLRGARGGRAPAGGSVEVGQGVRVEAISGVLPQTGRGLPARRREIVNRLCDRGVSPSVDE
jgi:hypothetical protein